MAIPDVISAEHQAQLAAIALELSTPDLPAWRRSELLRRAEEIAEYYTCDARFYD